MARPLRLECEGAIYHVIARGNERRDIFRDDFDRRLYLNRLGVCRDRLQFAVLAYCLMSNHVHLVLQRGPEPLSRVMLMLHSAYAQAFNRRHSRVGHLFQGRYKAFVVEKDRYFLALLRYVLRNPCEAALASRAESYAWSSARFMRSGRGPRWLDLDRLWPLLGEGPLEATSRYRELMAAAKTTDYETMPRFINAIRGSETFARQLIERSDISLRPVAFGWTAARVAHLVSRVLGISVEQMKGRGQDSHRARARSVAALVGWRHAGIPVARMAAFLGRDQSTLNKGVHRLESTSTANPELRQVIRLLDSRSSRVHV